MPLHSQSHGDGWPLVVLPSFGFDHAAMAQALEPAFDSTSEWARLYLDLPGSGFSPPGEPHSDSVLDDIVRTIQAELGNQRFAVLGWSYGGYLAAGLTRRLPWQIGGLMMICTGFKICPHDRDLTGVLASSPEPDWLADVSPNLHDHFTQAIGCQTGEVARRITAALERNNPVDETYLASLRADGFAVSDEDTPTPCDAPVCFLTGRRDRVAGYVGLFNALPGYDHASYVAVGEAGHYLPLEQPMLFAGTTQSWLDECLVSVGRDPG